jgi:hypothetical protein
MLTGIKSKFSLFVLLEKAVYPNHASWEQHRKLVTLLWSISAGVVLGALMVIILFWQNARH